MQVMLTSDRYYAFSSPRRPIRPPPLPPVPLISELWCSCVQVMLTTDQYYTLSSKCPGVKWLRQVAPEKMHAAAKCSDGR